METIMKESPNHVLTHFVFTLIFLFNMKKYWELVPNSGNCFISLSRNSFNNDANTI
jgi:hypothetical protein